MTIAGIALIIIAIAFLILVFSIIPAVKAVQKTALSVGSLADMMQNELQPAIKELTVLVSEMKTVGGGIAEHTDDVKKFMSAIGETGSNISTINRSVGVVASALNSTTAFVTGAKVAGKYIFQQYLNKRGGK